MKKTILYYTCNTHAPEIEDLCRRNLLRMGLSICAVSRELEIDFGDLRLVVKGERSPLTMHRQILAGLERLEADVVYLCENDVLYHPGHFEFLPAREDTFYYNTNVWRVRWSDGLAVWTDGLQQVSGLCARRELLLLYYTQRTTQLERDGNNRHYEPGLKQSLKIGRVENWESAWPNVDIRHGRNLTPSKWNPEEFRNPRYAAGWRTTYEIPAWGRRATWL